ncbi:hypothetical protein [Gulosibacter chungangensis]|uniref:hypothetical protein n=1 Tax=Gulosibacter chungangensis TaxID=979746 RepID=UPI0038508709
MLGKIGATSPQPSARMLMATVDGLVLHRVTVDPDAPIGPAIERAITACLN